MMNLHHVFFLLAALSAHSKSALVSAQDSKPWWWFGGGHGPAPAPSPAPGTPQPTQPTGSNKLKLVGDELDWKLGKCEGDCDRDKDCQGDLLCFKPEMDISFVWGCNGEPRTKRNVNYCIDPKDIPPTLEPTKQPTRRPTMRPTKKPTKRPTKAPTTSEPTSSPTYSPTFHPTHTPSLTPTVAPSLKPSVLEKLWMPVIPFIIDLTFPRHRIERMLSKRNPVRFQKREMNALRGVVATLLGKKMRIVSRHYWEVFLDIELKDEVITEVGSRDGGTITLSFEFSGLFAFADARGSVLPTKSEVEHATTKALNGNHLLRDLASSGSVLLASVQDLSVSWAGEGAVDTGGTISIPFLGLDDVEIGKMIGYALIAGLIVFCLILAAFLCRRRQKPQKSRVAVECMKGIVSSKPSKSGKQLDTDSVASKPSESDGTSNNDSYDGSRGEEEPDIDLEVRLQMEARQEVRRLRDKGKVFI